MQESDGVWFLPILGRVDGLRKLAEAVRETSPKARIVALLDQDDPELRAVEWELLAGWERVYLPGSPTTVEKLNLGFAAFPGEGFYGLLATDIIPLTAGWAAALAASVPHMGLSFGDDAIHGRRLPTHPVVSGVLVRALGWWAYPKAKHNGIDVYLRDLANRLGGCVYLDDVKFLHNHPCAGRGERDGVYARADSWLVHDQAIAYQWPAEQDSLVARLRGLL